MGWVSRLEVSGVDAVWDSWAIGGGGGGGGGGVQSSVGRSKNIPVLVFPSCVLKAKNIDVVRMCSLSTSTSSRVCHTGLLYVMSIRSNGNFARVGEAAEQRHPALFNTWQY